MMTPKERDELIIAHLGMMLNEQGFSFRISKSGLSWKNEHISVKVKTRGNKWSTAECSLRWIAIRVYSTAFRAAMYAGAPILGNGRGSPDLISDLDVRRPGGVGSIQVELTDHASCEAGAREVATHFRAFWDDHISVWLDPARSIEFLSSYDNLVRIDAIIGPDSPGLETPELEALIKNRVESTHMNNHSLLGEFLLATGRHDDLRRLAMYCSAYADSDQPGAERMHRLDWLIRWLDKYEVDI